MLVTVLEWDEGDFLKNLQLPHSRDSRAAVVSFQEAKKLSLFWGSQEE